MSTVFVSGAEHGADCVAVPSVAGEKRAMEMTEYGKHGKP
jgi:hypothetical protein